MRNRFIVKLKLFLFVIMLPLLLITGCAMSQKKTTTGYTTLSEINDVTSLRPGQELIIPLHDYEKGGVSLIGYQTVPVLTYHKFSRNKTDNMTVSERSFEEQMRFLKKNGYHVVTLDEFFDFRNFRAQLPT